MTSANVAELLKLTEVSRRRWQDLVCLGKFWRALGTILKCFEIQCASVPLSKPTSATKSSVVIMLYPRALLIKSLDVLLWNRPGARTLPNTKSWAGRLVFSMPTDKVRVSTSQGVRKKS